MLGNQGELLLVHVVVQSGGHRAAARSFTEQLGESCGATNECLKEMVRSG